MAEGTADFSKLKPRQRKFLSNLCQLLAVEPSAKAAGIDGTLPYKWRKSDPNFALCWEQAMLEAVPQVELAHFQHALGKDTLARIHILKNRHPAYREKPLEVSHTHTHTLTTGNSQSIATIAQGLAVLAGLNLIEPPAIATIKPRPGPPVIDLVDIQPAQIEAGPAPAPEPTKG